MIDGKPVLAILGGAGREGNGLAARWAAAGYDAVVGGRDATKARAVAAELAAEIPGAKIGGVDNDAAATAGEIVAPTAPLAPPKVNRVQLPEGGSTLVALTEAATLHGFHVGPLCNPVVAEALMSVPISINQRYTVPSSGNRITGLAG